MLSREVEESIQTKYEQLVPYLNETSLRMWAAIEAISLGHGGVTSVARSTGLSRTTIHAGIAEVQQSEAERLPLSCYGVVRRLGSGRKRLTVLDPTLLEDLESLVNPVSRGDPETPLRWTTKSTPKLAKQLQAMGHAVSQRTVCKLLWELGYSLQSNRKTDEGKHHPDRDAQFQHISQVVQQFQQLQQPVISVDAKKKELIGEYKNAGVEWQEKGQPTPVKMHDAC